MCVCAAGEGRGDNYNANHVIMHVFATTGHAVDLSLIHI